MIGGVTALINNVIYTTVINGVRIATMISGVSAWKTVGGPVRDTSIPDVVAVLHGVASADLVDRIGLPMR